MTEKNDMIEYILYKCPSCFSLFIENLTNKPFYESRIYWIKFTERIAEPVIFDDVTEKDFEEINKVDCWEKVPDNSTYIEEYYKNIGW